MANDLVAITHKILARGLLALRERVALPRLVNGSYSTEAARKGQTVDVPLPPSYTTRSVVPGATPPGGADTEMEFASIPLDQWKEVAFYLGDDEMEEVERNEHFIPMAVSEALRAISNDINIHLQGQYKAFFGAVGTAGTTPFASSVTDATNARKLLNQQLVPRDLRRGVLDYDAEANALALDKFSSFDAVGSREERIEGDLGRKYGIEWFADDHVQTHTTSGGAGWLVNGTPAAGAKVMAIDTGTGDPDEGDIFTIAGVDKANYPGELQQFAVTGYAGGQVSFYPALPSAPADNAALTFVASHKANLIFHRDAIAFAMRSMGDSVVLARSLGHIMATLQDPVSGIVVRMEVSRQHKRTEWSLDALYGAKVIRPELGVRLLG